MLLVSLSLNILVLVPVLFALSANGAAAKGAWGADTPARRILAAIYAAILSMSALLLVLLLLGHDVLASARALLAVQVIYKLLTAPLVGLRNPVVRSNLAIAAVHTVTLVVTAG